MARARQLFATRTGWDLRAKMPIKEGREFLRMPWSAPVVMIDAIVNHRLPKVKIKFLELLTVGKTDTTKPCSHIGNTVCCVMRVIARNVLVAFGEQHPETKVSLDRWYRFVKAAEWPSMADIQKAVPKAKALNGERVRFGVAGGNYRLVAAFDFRRQIAFVKFVGTHAAYDRIDALTASQF